MFLVDSARQDRADTGPLTYATFVAFFPHLIAGPIVRPKDIIPQLQQRDLAAQRRQPRRRTDDCSCSAWQRSWCWPTRSAASPIPASTPPPRRHLTLFEAWYAVLAYSLQIYFDFSGYSDMAIGLARMLNVRFPLNFASPYQARNIAEFWRRWHITLGAFLREYVYFPLGGSRCGAAAPQRQPARHHAAVRVVARRGVALRSLGRVARPVPDHCMRIAGVTLPRAARPGADAAGGRRGLGAVPRRQRARPRWNMLGGMAGLHGVALPQMIVHALPVLALVAAPVHGAAVPRRRPHAQLPGGLRLPAAGLGHRAAAAARARVVGAGARAGR